MELHLRGFGVDKDRAGGVDGVVTLNGRAVEREESNTRAVLQLGVLDFKVAGHCPRVKRLLASSESGVPSQPLA